MKQRLQQNLTKHGVAFDEATTVFDDPLYVDFYAPEHSIDEPRYLMIGTSQRGRLLIVSYTERSGDSPDKREGIDFKRKKNI